MHAYNNVCKPHKLGKINANWLQKEFYSATLNKLTSMIRLKPSNPWFFQAPHSVVRLEFRVVSIKGDQLRFKVRLIMWWMDRLMKLSAELIDAYCVSWLLPTLAKFLWHRILIRCHSVCWLCIKISKILSVHARYKTDVRRVYLCRLHELCVSYFSLT